MPDNIPHRVGALEREVETLKRGQSEIRTEQKTQHAILDVLRQQGDRTITLLEERHDPVRSIAHKNAAALFDYPNGALPTLDKIKGIVEKQAEQQNRQRKEETDVILAKLTEGTKRRQIVAGIVTALIAGAFGVLSQSPGCAGENALVHERGAAHAEAHQQEQHGEAQLHVLGRGRLAPLAVAARERRRAVGKQPVPARPDLARRVPGAQRPRLGVRLVHQADRPQRVLPREAPGVDQPDGDLRPAPPDLAPQPLRQSGVPRRAVVPPQRPGAVAEAVAPEAHARPELRPRRPRLPAEPPPGGRVGAQNVLGERHARAHAVQVPRPHHLQDLSVGRHHPA